MGKQEKMSFMSAKSNKFSSQTKEAVALPCSGGNPFVDQRSSWEMMGLGAPAASNICVTEYQNQPPFFNPPSSTPFFNPPSSTPFDNFLTAKPLVPLD